MLAAWQEYSAAQAAVAGQGGGTSALKGVGGRERRMGQARAQAAKERAAPPQWHSWHLAGLREYLTRV